ncbi:MAG: FAD-dependent oxidoreductase [Deltaproteobacteria bacterium]|jgi:formate dehydrogenase beta subunit|nr:FAD-dependent oxidoreductase [Deltaproteobacteria bacterium]
MSDIIFSSWGREIVENRGDEEQEPVSIKNLDFPEYFKQDEKIKASMGWKGIVLRSPEVDIIDLCREYFEAVLEHSKTCDKCNYCKTGWEEMLEVFQDMANGEATEEDLEFLQSAAEAIVSNAKCSIGKSGPAPLFDALKYFADDFSQAVSGEKQTTKGTYYSKLTAPCMDACPIHLDIPKYVELIKDAKFAESLTVIRERLPIAGIVGRVCFRPCEKHCRRGNLDESISIKALKRFVADHEIAEQKEPEYEIAPSEKTGKVAIIGAGPAGITCAYHLARAGHEITIYEALDEPGGMSAVGIPDYRLPRNILHAEVQQIQKMGVAINYGQTIGNDLTLSQLENEFDAVFIGIGAQDSTKIGIEGEDQEYQGVIPGLAYLREVNAGADPYPQGKKVVVIGGGNVAIDCVRCSLRTGKEDIHLVYRRTRSEMPADEVEIHDAEEEQVQFHFLTAPVRIRAEEGKVVGLECIKMELGEPDDSGRPRPVPVEGSEFVFDCDTIISAIGQQVDLALLAGMDDVQTSPWKTIVVDEYTKQSSRPKIFVAGDCETGPDALITACAGGRRASHSIDRFINGQPLDYDDSHYFDKLFETVKVFDPDEEILKVESKPRFKPGMLPPETRKSNFDEVEQGLSAQEAVAEAERCLRCYQVATIAV